MRTPQSARTYLSAIAVATVILGSGAAYTAHQLKGTDYTAQAYTSAANPQDPETAPSSYVVNFPDANLKSALNSIIATATGTTRAATQDITAGEMSQLVLLTGAQTLGSKGISNIEGLQFLVNATYIDLTANNLTDISPLQDLKKVYRLELSNNKLTNDNIPKLVAIPTLTNLSVARNYTLTDVSPIMSRTDWVALNLGGLNFSDTTQISPMSQLKYLSLDNLRINSKLDLAPLASLDNLQALNVGHQLIGLTDDDVLPIKDLPSLTALNISGNDIRDLQKITDAGFDNLVASASTLVQQKRGIINLSQDQDTFPNPLRNADGSIVPVIETDKIKNVDASGNPNQNGGHIKLVDTHGTGSTKFDWNTTVVSSNLAGRPFTGFITVNYQLPELDTEGPAFTPAAPSKIVSRKGAAINITDVTAEDNPGGSGLNADGITNNAATIGLDPANPAAGNYTLTYSATDNQNNTSTVNREVEITDADALEAKVAEVTPDLLKGHTAASVAQVQAKKQAAEAIIANNASTQAEIDQALAELVDAISDLEVDRTELADAINDAQSQPDYIRNNPAVAAAMANAEALLLDEDASIDQISAAAQALRQAVQDAIDAEQQKQQAATTAIENATASPSPATFANAQSAVDQIGDPAVKAQKQAELDALVNNYNAIVGNLEDLIAKAQDPATTAGMTADSVKALEEALADVLANFSNTSSQAEVEAMTAALDAALKGLTPVAPAPTPVPTDPQTGAGQNTNTGTGATAPDSGVASQSMPAVIAAALGAISLFIGGIVALVRKRSDR